MRFFLLIASFSTTPRETTHYWTTDRKSNAKFSHLAQWLVCVIESRDTTGPNSKQGYFFVCKVRQKAIYNSCLNLFLQTVFQQGNLKL